MPRRIETFFSDADRSAIRAATADAERRTSAELVVYVTERCDPHPEVTWKSTLIGGAVGVMCAAAGDWRFGGWGESGYLWLLIGLQIGFVLGYLASRSDSAARRLIDDRALSSRVEGRAARAFLEEEVFATAGRTGILIFVALFEHRVLVLRDAGIDERVDPEDWREIADELASSIRRGARAKALVRAVERCAELLVERGLVALDPRNELADEPRFRHE
ncbi:MAG: hypothetical protein WCE62_03960, partial [Polyangiales bacterium]